MGGLTSLCRRGCRAVYSCTSSCALAKQSGAGAPDRIAALPVIDMPAPAFRPVSQSFAPDATQAESHRIVRATNSCLAAWSSAHGSLAVGSLAGCSARFPEVSRPMQASTIHAATSANSLPQPCGTEIFQKSNSRNS